MNRMTMSDFQKRPGRDDSASAGSARMEASQPNFTLQVLTLIFFGIFSIVAVAVAFAYFWVAGMFVALALVHGWRGFGSFPGSRRRYQRRVDEAVDAVAPVAAPRTSGNASFDSYRTETIRRLEEEQVNFEDFLQRLRQSKDKSEFDHFMEDRARAARQIPDAGTDRMTGRLTDRETGRS